eukprot:365859-Chlamydomonas_euryale.AAC.1
MHHASIAPGAVAGPPPPPPPTPAVHQLCQWLLSLSIGYAGAALAADAAARGVAPPPPLPLMGVALRGGEAGEVCAAAACAVDLCLLLRNEDVLFSVVFRLFSAAGHRGPLLEVRWLGCGVWGVGGGVGLWRCVALGPIPQSICALRGMCGACAQQRPSGPPRAPPDPCVQTPFHSTAVWRGTRLAWLRVLNAIDRTAASIEVQWTFSYGGACLSLPGACAKERTMPAWHRA